MSDIFVIMLITLIIIVIGTVLLSEGIAFFSLVIFVVLIHLAIGIAVTRPGSAAKRKLARAQLNPHQKNSVDSNQRKPGVNAGMVTGSAISILATMYLFTRGESIGIIASSFTLLNLTGLLLSATLSSLTGPSLTIVANMFFFPIGMIGILGARRAINDYSKVSNHRWRSASRKKQEKVRQ